MPDGVPPAVSKSFSSMIPAIIVMLVVAAIYGYAEKFTGMNVWQIVTKFLSTPLQGLSQNVIMVIVMYFMIDLLWIFGLHGANIVGSVTTPILTPLSNANVNRFANGEEPLNTVVGGLQSGFAFLGGSGATLGCIIAIFIFSKSKASKTIAQLALAPGLFEINEPLTFGLPIVMNMVLAIPFIIGPIVLGVVTFYLMESGIIRRPCIEAPWVTPPVLIGFLCTGGDIKGAIWNVVEIVLLTVLWTPFIIMNDKVEAGNA
jgi:PTS system, lactose/cellobiose family IIC component